MSRWDDATPPEGTTHFLTYTTVANQRIIQMRDGQPVSLPPGAHHTKIEDYMRWEADQLVLSIRTHMLTEQGGDPIVKKAHYTFLYTYAVKPRWMPSFLWRRVKWVEAKVPHEFAVICQPKWKYPEASIIEELGKPLQMVTFETFGPRENPPVS